MHTDGNRRYKRFTIDVMNITGKMTVSNVVSVIDINPGGAKLKADLRLNIGSEYVLRLNTEDTSIKVKGTIEWSSISEPVEGTDGDIIPMYTAGIKFTSVPADLLPALHSFVEDFNRHEEEKLTGVGVHIEKHGNMLMDEAQDYKVKKISLGGMLITSGRPFEIGSRFNMEITIPGNRELQFHGRIASCNLAKGNVPLPYEIGIEFREMKDLHKQQLSQFIRKLETGEEEEQDIWFRHKDI